MPEVRGRKVLRRIGPEEMAERTRTAAAHPPTRPEAVQASFQQFKATMTEQKKLILVGNEIWKTTREYVPFLRHIPLIGPVISGAGITTGRAISRVLAEISIIRETGFKGAKSMFKLGMSIVVTLVAIAAAILAIFSISKIFRTLLSTIFTMFSFMLDLLVIPFIPLFMVIIKFMMKMIPIFNWVATNILEPMIEGIITIMEMIMDAPAFFTSIRVAVISLGTVLGGLLGGLLTTVMAALPALLGLITLLSGFALGVVAGFATLGALGTEAIKSYADMGIKLGNWLIKGFGWVTDHLEDIGGLFAAAKDIIAGIGDWALTTVGDVLTWINENLTSLKDLFTNVNNFFTGIFSTFIKWISDKWEGFGKIVKNIFDWLTKTGFNLLTTIATAIGQIINWMKRSWLFETVFGMFKEAQAGMSYVPRTMPVMVHAGEAIVPAAARQFLGMTMTNYFILGTPMTSGGLEQRIGDNFESALRRVFPG